MNETLLTDTPAYPLWKQFGIRHHHGINIPLFSLHSQNSCGIGEFFDLLPLIDWCRTIGFDIIQLLPLNDPGLDTSPYNALSAYALNPIHLSIASLPHLELYPNLVKQLNPLQQLNHTQCIDYNTVRKGKEDFLMQYYKEENSTIVSSKSYLDFLAQTPWLKEYALFKSLKQQYHWISWEDWPAEISSPSQETLQLLYQKYSDDIQWHSVIQYLCYQQLQAVKQYASSRGIFLMGDLPILISRDSADVWLHQSLFNLNYAAGAPPDFYNAEGQKWGFPLYNWEELSKNNYSWWKERLAFAERFYHLYRIDHVIGFFRIWAIRHDAKTGKEGKFIPEDRSLWPSHGETLLRMLLKNSSMLPIAEDLGDVPLEVRPCLKTLGICSTKVMRWERRWDIDKSFIPSNDYPLISLTTVSTHDSETLSLWWRDHPDEAQEFAKYAGWEYTPLLSHEHLYKILWSSHHTGSLLHVNLLQEYLALIPGLTWPRLEEERINLPGIVSDANWTYRFRPTVEEMIANTPLANAMRAMP